MALHGHTILELTDVRTGRTRRVEKDNLVTDAVGKVFNTLPTLLNFSQIHYMNGSWDDLLTPLFGGLLLYDTALGSDAGRLFAPAAAGVTGSGCYGLQNTGSNPCRGSWNTAESELDFSGGTAKFVYDFTTSQGNGTIASVCLTSLRGGYFGETAEACTAQADVAYETLGAPWGLGCLYPYLTVHRAVAEYGMPLEVDLDNDILLTARLTVGAAQKTLTLYKLEAGLRRLRLLQNTGASRTAKVIGSETYDLSAVVQNAASGWESCCRLSYDPEARRLYLVCTAGGAVAANAQVKLWQLDPATGETGAVTVTNTTGGALEGTVSSAPYNRGPLLNGMVYGGRLYLCQDGGGALYAFPLDDPTDVVEIERNGLEMTYVQDAYAGRLYGYDASNGYVLNTAANRLLRCEGRGYTGYSAYEMGFVPLYPQSPLVLRTTGAKNYCFPVVRHNYLATINDLAAPVVKTASQTMKVTYILTEA